jgi:hypothetical protein
MVRQLESGVKMGSEVWVDLRNLVLRALIDWMMNRKVRGGEVTSRSMVIVGLKGWDRG